MFRQQIVSLKIWNIFLLSVLIHLQTAANQLIPKEMEVCPVCGAFLVVGDAPQRVEEHLQGKQHMGYARCRDTIDNLKVCRLLTHLLNTQLDIVKYLFFN